MVIFSLLMPTTFPHVTTLQAMMFQLPELGLLSLAMAIPLISGGINLAIIATANSAALLMAWILTALMPPDSGGMVLALWLTGALIAGLLLCVLVGLVTGLLVAVLGVHPILVTLGTMTLLHGFRDLFHPRAHACRGSPMRCCSSPTTRSSAYPISFILFVVVALLVHMLMTRTALGMRIHMIGSNLEATRYSGVDIRRVLVSVYVLSSLLCFLAAVVMMARFNSAGADIAAVLSPDHHPGGDPRRYRPLWRLRPHWRPVRRLVDPPGDRERVQPHGYQPAPRARLLGIDPAAGDGRQAPASRNAATAAPTRQDGALRRSRSALSTRAVTIAEKRPAAY